VWERLGVIIGAFVLDLFAVIPASLLVCALDIGVCYWE